ncbi:hypothetical protein CPB85DRAFT_623803 [Mucidula mucida]|nr:hypothetical protein CPB85DRAFT_623803 [Mucidula mucida]
MRVIIRLTDENIAPQRTSRVDSRFRTHDPNVEDVSLHNRPDIVAQRQLEKHLLNTLLDAEHEASTFKDLLSQSRATKLFSLLVSLNLNERQHTSRLSSVQLMQRFQHTNTYQLLPPLPNVSMRLAANATLHPRFQKTLNMIPIFSRLLNLPTPSLALIPLVI